MFKLESNWTALALATVGAISVTPGTKTQQPVAIPCAPSRTELASAPQAAGPRAPFTAPGPRPHVMGAVRQLSYACSDNHQVMVRIGETSANVMFKGRRFTMKQVEAASGSKYSDGTVVWWTRGKEGYLADDGNPEKIAVLAKRCKLQTASTGDSRAKKSAARPVDSVSGTVTYLQRTAMPPTAELIVQLQDVTAPDAGAKIVAEASIVFGKRQVPVPFELKFDPAKIDPQHLYAVTARIFTESQLRFMNAKSYRVLTQGHPANVNVILVPIETAGPPKQ